MPETGAAFWRKFFEVLVLMFVRPRSVQVGRVLVARTSR
jgi:hypothetical protein